MTDCNDDTFNNPATLARRVFFETLAVEAAGKPESFTILEAAEAELQRPWSELHPAEREAWKAATRQARTAPTSWTDATNNILLHQGRLRIRNQGPSGGDTILTLHADDPDRIIRAIYDNPIDGFRSAQLRNGGLQIHGSNAADRAPHPMTAPADRVRRRMLVMWVHGDPSASIDVAQETLIELALALRANSTTNW